MGNIQPATVSPTATTAVADPNAPVSGSASTGGGLGSLLTNALTAGAGIYGSQNAAEAQQHADVAAMDTQNTAMGNISGYWQPQQTAGVGAVNALSAAQGLNGSAPDYSGFEKMPGYQFAIQQGTQAAERAASAQGSAYTPNTAINVGNYVTGTAMQDYNTYISQLMGTAGLGSTANQNLQGAQLQTSANVSQLQQNTGQAAASAYTSSANAGAGQVGNIINALLGSGGNSSGAIGSIANWLKGGSAAAGAAGAAGTGSTGYTTPSDITSMLNTPGLTAADLSNLNFGGVNGLTDPTVSANNLFGSNGASGTTDLSQITNPADIFGTSSGATAGYDFSSDPTLNP
jgi:hypothetical protein